MSVSNWRPFNPNPRGLLVGDCTVRSICAVTGLNWRAAHDTLCGLSSVMADMPSADRVWHELLRWCGFTRQELPNRCPQCCTVKDFCREHPRGIYVLGPPAHAVAVINGQYWDAWDSGFTVPDYVLTKNGGIDYGI